MLRKIMLSQKKLPQLYELSQNTCYKKDTCYLKINVIRLIHVITKYILPQNTCYHNYNTITKYMLSQL